MFKVAVHYNLWNNSCKLPTNENIHKYVAVHREYLLVCAVCFCLPQPIIWIIGCNWTLEPTVGGISMPCQLLPALIRWEPIKQAVWGALHGSSLPAHDNCAHRSQNHLYPHCEEKNPKIKIKWRPMVLQIGAKGRPRLLITQVLRASAFPTWTAVFIFIFVWCVYRFIFLSVFVF